MFGKLMKTFKKIVKKILGIFKKVKHHDPLNLDVK